MEIINKHDLLSARNYRDLSARRLVLEALETALKSVDPAKTVCKHVTIKNEMLRVKDTKFDLKRYKRIFVVGGGKASGGMAEAIEHILGERVIGGVVNVLAGTTSRFETQKVDLIEASHPIPDIKGVEGVKRILKLAEKVEDRDLVICLISGGGSALMPYPLDRISLQDKQHTTRLLLKSGASINEINSVRKHLSRIKGGRLAKAFYPAEVLSIIISDVINDPLDVIASGPTVPDSTTFDHAVNVIKKYHLWNEVSKSIRQVLIKGKSGSISETPKPHDKAFKRVHNFIIGNIWSACITTQRSLRRKGLHTTILTPYIQGEAKEVGRVLSSIARSIDVKGTPIPRPAALVSGGETTVTVQGAGKGGRNQEVVLSASLGITGMEGVVVASLGTDGLDGITNAAGAIADGDSVQRACLLKLRPESFLQNNDAYHFFSKLGDLIITGPTGTNVGDIILLVLS